MITFDNLEQEILSRLAAPLMELEKQRQELSKLVFDAAYKFSALPEEDKDDYTLQVTQDGFILVSKEQIDLALAQGREDDTLIPEG